MSYPTQSDLKIFLEVNKLLNNFELNQRYIRGYGAFSEDYILKVRPAVMRVTGWLYSIMENQDNERIDTIEENDRYSC